MLKQDFRQKAPSGFRYHCNLSDKQNLQEFVQALSFRNIRRDLNSISVFFCNTLALIIFEQHIG